MDMETAQSGIKPLASFYSTIAEDDEEQLEEEEEHPVETMDTAVMGKGMLYKGKKMKTPSQLSYGLDYTGSGVDESKGIKMKITKRQLRGLIKEACGDVVMAEPEIYGHGGKAQMAKSQLYQLAQDAAELHDLLN